MDERQQRVLDIYEDFRRVGIISDEPDDGLDDVSAVRQTLQLELDQFKADIMVAYEGNETQRKGNLTKAALLGMVINGGSQEELDDFFDNRKLSRGISIEHRIAGIIDLIPKVHVKAQKIRQGFDRAMERQDEADRYRSLDDMLVTILNRNDMSETDQGCMRLLFGFVELLPSQASPQIVAQMKSNAAGTLRHKLTVNKKELSKSPRTAEGERMLLRLCTSSRSGYPSMRSLAEAIAHDTESRASASYGKGVEQNQRLIETYMCDAFEVMYPRHSEDS